MSYEAVESVERHTLPSAILTVHKVGPVMSRQHRVHHAIALVLSLVLCLSSVALTAEPTRWGTLRVAYGNRIFHLDFHTAPGYEMMWVAMNIGCSLVNITPDGQFVGDTAASWNVSSDGLTYTLGQMGFLVSYCTIGTVTCHGEAG